MPSKFQPQTLQFGLFFLKCFFYTLLTFYRQFSDQRQTPSQFQPKNTIVWSVVFFFKRYDVNAGRVLPVYIVVLFWAFELKTISVDQVLH